jgi:cytochrome oxidase Cu insertion factor (SCO1/SenC/PrrC family)
VPAKTGSEKIPDITVWDEQDQKSSLWEKLQSTGEGPVIVLPVYTRCTLSCPTLTRKLLQAATSLESAAYRVLIFSFDPSDNAESLRTFRQREHLPAKWLVVRAQDAQIRRFVEYFRYSIMTEGSLLIHPNELFLLDDGLQWRATLVDVDWSAGELREWLKRVADPGVRGWVAMNPEKLAWTGFSGLLLGAGVCAGWLIRRKPS